MIITTSGIPISRGSKSSSSAADSILPATFNALETEYSHTEIINMGFEASILAKVTLTGAFDDPCTAYFGDEVVTDNLDGEVLTRYPKRRIMMSLSCSPQEDQKMRCQYPEIEGNGDILKSAHDLALEGKFPEAMKIRQQLQDAFLQL